MRRLWRCSDLFDERQMQLRGKVCRHALMLIVLLMLAESIVREECGPLWRPVESALVMLMLVGGYAGMRLILADAYVGYDARGKLLMGVMTLLGIACLACNVVDALGGTWTLVQQGMLSSTAALLIVGLVMALLSVCYWVRFAREKRAVQSDEA